MSETTVTISDYGELTALLKALMTAKFGSAENDPSVPSSPLVASVADRVVEALREQDLRAHGEERAASWDEWRRADRSRGEWDAAKRMVDRNGTWSRWNDAEKRHFASVLLSPLVASDDQLAEFVAEIDSA